MTHLPYGVGQNRQNRPLNRWTQLKWMGLGVFVLIIGGMLAYEYSVREPRAKCEASGHWWSEKDRKCATVVYLPDWTGRKPDGKAATDHQILWPDASDPTRTAAAPKSDKATQSPVAKP